MRGTIHSNRFRGPISPNSNPLGFTSSWGTQQLPGRCLDAEAFFGSLARGPGIALMSQIIGPHPQAATWEISKDWDLRI